ncbi:MAG TPA: tRNA (adenosine(37)-N6)-threonylcarbamoyltransferase complex transferase subunit TsaD [Clostridiaceae bacterium]|nr:tRNA (adenosine(37)-N6)-threonylcarbamoyltransferase complex transferase subunit TsaD [Clostridiaceae bacterium]
MYILGIESSCDETAAAVIKDGRTICSNIIASQIDIHRVYGGVVPEIASRHHLNNILPVVASSLETAKVELCDLAGISVTFGPGLVGALLVGVAAAKGLALTTGLPLYPVHHIAAHIAANFLSDPAPQPPFVSLVVSGGHSHIIRVKSMTDYEILGSTRDDAAGEAFDKVARAVGLGYPGGPLIDRASEGGNPQAIHFPETDFGAGEFDYSFSGVKTAALNYLNQMEQYRRRDPEMYQQYFTLSDFCASFQYAVNHALIRQLMEAAAEFPNESIVLAGGVAANRSLRADLAEACDRAGRQLFCPPLELCTDNAAMVAALGYQLAKAGVSPATGQLDAVAGLPIDRWSKQLSYIN